MNEELISKAKDYEDSIYIEIVSEDFTNPLAYHIGDKSGIIEPKFHTGTFQDSVLYVNNALDIDFRIFIYPWSRMDKTYNISSNIQTVVIKNCLTETYKHNYFLIEPGETKVFTADQEKEAQYPFL